MTIIDFFGCFWDISDGIETIPRKYHDIILREESSFWEKSIFENCVSESFCEDRLSQWDHLPSESELSRIKTPLREKTRYQICSDRLCHERYESFPSTTIEEGIMEYGDLGFFVSHTKRIPEKDEKTIGFVFSFNSIYSLYMEFLDQKGNRIAIIADWLIDFGWAELVISHLLEAFPEADIYTSVCYTDHPMLVGRRVYTSWLQQIPFLNRRHKLAGILRPWAFRSFDLSGYDIILSSSSAEAKNAGYIKRGENTTHFCYCHTPTRYYWSHYEEYRNMMEFGIFNPIARFVLDRLIGWLRKLDYEAAQWVDYFIANSENTRGRIEKYYDRESEVIYPGVNIPVIPTTWEKWDYYLGLGRCIPYKRFDLLVDAFNQNWKKLILCTATDTPLFRELRARSKPNIEWKYRVSNEEKDKLMQWAKAFLFPPLEDFWLVPIEAMAMGTPVIAYGEWGALETVVDGVTGLFFSPQTPMALNDGIKKFETMKWDREKIREHVEKFSKERFQKNIQEFIENHVK